MSVREASLAALLRAYYPQEVAALAKAWVEARKTWVEASKTWEEARKTREEAYKTWEESYNTWVEARNTWEEARKTWEEARKTWEEARNTWGEAVSELVRRAITERNLDPTKTYDIPMIGELLCQTPSECSQGACVSPPLTTRHASYE